MLTRLNRLSRRIRIVLRIVRVLLGKKHVYGNVTIRRSEDFISLTVRAMELLEETVPETYQLVQKHIGDILSGTPSGVFADMLWLGPTFVIIGPSGSNRSTPEYAGVLAHEAYHCELYSNAERVVLVAMSSAQRIRERMLKSYVFSISAMFFESLVCLK